MHEPFFWVLGLVAPISQVNVNIPIRSVCLQHMCVSVCTCMCDREIYML